MTPQLRQAIQLLQYSNIEANQFIEDELLKNPLLAHDDTPQSEPDSGSRGAEPPEAAEGMDAAALVNSQMLPSAAEAPLDMDTSNSYDPGSIADGGAVFGYGGGQGDSEDDWNPVDALSSAKPNLREHLEQQARLTFTGRADLAIAAALIAGLDAVGRLAEPPDAIAAALGLDLDHVEQVRARMMRFDPTGIFARDLRECLEVQLAEKNRLDPAMAALLANLDVLARRDMRSLLEICGVDLEDLAGMIAEIKRLDPKPAAQYEIEPLRPLIPDVLMRPLPIKPDLASFHGEAAPDWLLEINPDTMPRLPRPHHHFRLQGNQGVLERADAKRQLAGKSPGIAGADHPARLRRNHPPAGGFLPPRHQPSAPAYPARYRRRGGAARKHGQPGDLQQIHLHPARHLRAEILLHHRALGRQWRHP
jgi:RNA polymerase sigma-54 factor